MEADLGWVQKEGGHQYLQSLLAASGGFGHFSSILTIR